MGDGDETSGRAPFISSSGAAAETLSLAPPLVFVPEHMALPAVAHMFALLAALRPGARSAGRSLADLLLELLECARCREAPAAQ